jgi:hypothetical protein
LFLYVQMKRRFIVFLVNSQRYHIHKVGLDEPIIIKGLGFLSLALTQKNSHKTLNQFLLNKMFDNLVDSDNIII